MDKTTTKTNFDGKTHPSYRPLDYPKGLDHFLDTFPPEKRQEVHAAVVQARDEQLSAQKYVTDRMRQMDDLPHILYKYVPLHVLTDEGSQFPWTLRATQPAALNDVMEANIRTQTELGIDPDRYQAVLSASLKRIFGDDALTDDEMSRRRQRYGDPRVSTVIRDFLSRFVGVVSFSSDPLVITMWAHYAQNSGVVVGYKTAALRELGIDIKRVLYMELAPVYTPTRGDTVKLDFVDDERRRKDPRYAQTDADTPLIGPALDFIELRKDWRQLARLLFVKGKPWEYEKEIRLLVALQNTRALEDQSDIRVLDVPPGAIEGVYVGPATPTEAVAEIRRRVEDTTVRWSLKYTDSHAYRMQVTSTHRMRPRPATSRRSF